MQKHSKIRNVPFPRTCGATGNDTQKLHAPAFTYFRGAVLMHEVSCRQERPANRALLPVLSFAQSYSTLLPGLSGGQLACGGRRTWESHPSEDLSELHRWFEAVAVQKYHYRQMRSWRDGLPSRFWMNGYRWAPSDSGPSLTRAEPCRWSWRVLRIAFLLLTEAHLLM